MRKPIASVATIVVLAGCSADGSNSVDVNSTKDLVDLLQRTTHFDYNVIDTPANLLDVADIAVVGEVVSVDSALQDKGSGPPVGAVIVGLRAVETWKDGPSINGNTVYYWFNRPTEVDISHYQNGLPLGTRIVLFAHEDTGVKLIESTAEFDTLYSAHPQGHIIESEDNHTVNVWASENENLPEWEGLDTVAELRQATNRP
ncbi:hypothetical protein [Streptomyces sp. JJ38]|uniref:hypothetical protein n=1 Tax=Streptomyces sp. JJ38 TaxID=2738128 RepID=UPI001C5786F1|nr:hypothetical protein [Streptomyces sp. JJ38]MBW1595633.1 hypothetical protein [Streptomyces sp. JJ38]